MMVKICGITSREDAQAAVGAGASALGFNFFAKSPRFLTPEAAADIAAVVPASVLKVGVFVNEAQSKVADIARTAGLDLVQLHGGDAPDGLRLWRACRVNAEGVQGLENAAGAEAVLLDTAVPGMHGGTGQSFAWHLARIEGWKVVVAGGLDGDNVRDAIRAARPWGVDACSRLESAPGRKDHRKMTEFIHAALAEIV
ncbi:MAG TPA: phosphoribosylanthranilate isomerase [Bryobacteraceae bacterium]|nr:phosphoribosylanthranilate isomerase [Bryobacteraceae bacterium]